MTDKPEDSFCSGFIAVCGPPNAGKSTLTNYLTGEKISITSRKPQTTRNRIMGVVNRPASQLALMDTPGIFEAKGELNTHIVKSAMSAMSDVDLILLLIDVSRPPHTAGESLVLEQINQSKKPVILTLNKIDLIKKYQLLALIDRWQKLYSFSEIVPISAKKGDQTETLMCAMESHLPAGGPLFPEDMLTDISERFLAAELIREKVFRLTEQEIPYSTAVEINTFTENPDESLIRIQATIHVEKDSQKGVIIGAKGRMLKKIGEQSRHDIQRMTGTRVYLELFVRVQEKWRSKPALIKEFGYK